MLNDYSCIDIRDYCESYRQALCITDADGVITYMNRLYCQETGLDSSAIGTHEPFTDPISKKVIEKGQTVSFGNAGITTPSKTGRFVTGVPIFDRNNRLVNIVITLAPEREIFRRFREMKDLLSQQQTIRVLEAGDEKTLSLLGRDPKIKEIRRLIRRVAATNAAVLITGESGTGKEVVAQHIHDLGRKSKGEMVVLNCAALPENLLESELFGYEKGAFTGALSSGKAGLFEMASGGSLFLDEINSLPLALQGKLLRAVETKTIQRIGSTKSKKVDFRLIAASNEDLLEAVIAKRFRADLYYRINVVPIELPPLRERQEDIIPMALFFLQQYNKKYNKNKELTNETLQAICSYDWPGNVRELKNFVERSVIMSATDQINLTDIGPVAASHGQYCDPETMDRDRKISYFHSTADELLEQGLSLREYMNRCEQAYLTKALQKYKTTYAAAEKLRTSQSGIMRKKKKYGL